MKFKGQSLTEYLKGKYKPAVKNEEGVIPPTVEASWNMFEELLSAELQKYYEDSINTSEDSLRYERKLHPYRVVQEAIGNPYIKILKPPEEGDAFPGGYASYFPSPSEDDTMYVYQNYLRDDYKAEAGHGAGLGNLNKEELKTYRDLDEESTKGFTGNLAYTTPGTAEFETHSILQPLIDAFISHYRYGNLDVDKKLDKKFLKDMKKHTKITKKAKLIESTFGKMFPKLAESLADTFFTLDPSEKPSDYLLQKMDALKYKHTKSNKEYRDKHKGHNH